MKNLNAKSCENGAFSFLEIQFDAKFQKNEWGSFGENEFFPKKMRIWNSLIVSKNVKGTHEHTLLQNIKKIERVEKSKSLTKPK